MSDLAWNTDVKLACAGDRDAFARLIRSYQNEMYAMAKSLLYQDEDCADAIQEAILNAYRGLPRLREPAYFRTWLFRILIRAQTHVDGCVTLGVYRRFTGSRVVFTENVPEAATGSGNGSGDSEC